MLFSIAVAGEIAGRVRGRKTGLVDARTIAIRMCHGRGHEKPRALSFRNIHPLETVTLVGPRGGLMNTSLQDGTIEDLRR